MTIEWVDTEKVTSADAMAPKVELHIIDATVRKFELWVAADFMIEFSRQPGRWHRFWQRVLLGFEWKAKE